MAITSNAEAIPRNDVPSFKKPDLFLLTTAIKPINEPISTMNPPMACSACSGFILAIVFNALAIRVIENPKASKVSANLPNCTPSFPPNFPAIAVRPARTPANTTIAPTADHIFF